MRSDSDLTARARIGNAALELFGSEGVNRVSIRAIAAKAGVSPALVVHHFGSKEGLRAACDHYVISLVRGDPDDPVDLADTSGLAAMLEAAEPVRRYLARAFLDGTEQAAALFDEIVETTAAWLQQGSDEGWVRPAADARARAALYVTWLLAPLAFGEHLSRVLDVADLHHTDATLRYSRTAVDMLTHGVFSDERMLSAWDGAATKRGTR
ncbi:TetR/AcrR family transcriptional regulator [Streptosporangium longisporum]|uniref:TetR/AcrR family transcriptional regulator n=1 Tax=Streptosporangium longisporum TaxID=46187 RepID=A0ABN3Y8U5_9ACTN